MLHRWGAMSSGYKDHAYERTIVQQLQRVMLDRYISSDSPPKEGLICEEVFRSESDIPQDALLKVFEKLQLWENDQRAKMNSFKWTQEGSPLPFLEKDPAKPPPSAEAKKSNGPNAKATKRKKARPPEGGGSGS